MERVTKPQLEWIVDRIALYLERPGRCWERMEDGSLRSNVGALKLDYAACYGGYSLVEMDNESGGERTLSGSRKSPREMLAYLRGMMDALDMPNVYVVNNADDAKLLRKALA